jgi:hypothetical protein
MIESDISHSDGMDPEILPHHSSDKEFCWLAVMQDDANRGNFRAAFSVKHDEVKIPPIPDSPISPPRVRDIRCTTPQAPAWEYKIGIAPANSSADEKDVQELFLKVLGKRGWIFVSEHQGIFHFKRPKQ